MASIKPYTLSNGKTKYEYFISNGINPGTGKQIKIHKRGFDTIKEAEKAAKIIEGQIAAGQYSKKNLSRTRISDFMDAWLASKKSVKEGTIISYNGFMRSYIKPRLANYQIGKYGVEAHQKFIDDLLNDKTVGRSGEGLKISTAKVLNTVMSTAFNWGIKSGYMTINPATHVEFPRQSLDKSVKYYTYEQSQKFLDQAKKEKNAIWYPIALLILDSGLRKGEVLGAQWSDVDFSKSYISIARERLLAAEKGEEFITDDPKTSSGVRPLPITQRTKQGLLSYRNYMLSTFRELPATIDGEHFIFINTVGKGKGLPPKGSSVNAAFNRIADKAELPRLTVHQFRHTFAVRARQAGVPLEDIKDLLGHKEISTTQIYAHITPEVRERSMNLVEEYLGELSKGE